MTEIEALFNQLADDWIEDTMFQSSVWAMCQHPKYQMIIGLGEEAIPLILRRMHDAGGHWFYALASIAGKDVATGETTVTGARDKWLAWGRDQGYLPT